MNKILLTRREAIATGAAAMLVSPQAVKAASEPVVLTASVVPRTLPGNVGPSDLWLYNDTIAPVLRIRRNELFTATFRNRLTEHSAIHWHGVRVPHAMDGVPYITQPPVRPGESFTYKFAPPDPGTFFSIPIATPWRHSAVVWLAC